MSWADERGATLAFTAVWERFDDRKRPPWQRHVKRSNGRTLVNTRTIRAIRGIHEKTRRWRDAK